MSAQAKTRRVDPRIARSRSAAVEAARTLFLQKGYAGTTMEEIAALAGIAKRTLYNNYADKEELFTQIVADVMVQAERFAHELPSQFEHVTRGNLSTTLHDLARRMALMVLRPEVIALRRMLIGEARSFPELAQKYFDAAPGRVLVVLASGFKKLSGDGLLVVSDARRAAEQFAYLVVGAPLDRAMLVGKVPAREQVMACARDGAEAFLVRYASNPRTR